MTEEGVGGVFFNWKVIGQMEHKNNFFSKLGVKINVR